MVEKLVFESATSLTEHQLRRLLRENPLAGEIAVSLEREPNAFHAAETSGESYQLMLARRADSGDVIASGGRFELPMYINGKPCRTGYFGELRAEGGLRQRRQLLFGSYRQMHRYHELGSVPFYLTTIIADNRAARRLLEAGLGDMPTYRPLEPLVTFTIPVRSGKRSRGRRRRIASVSSAELAEIAALLSARGPDYQFHPVWTESILRCEKRCRGLVAGDFFVTREAGSLAGCVALWDQRAFKQTVIRGYSKRLARGRRVLNLLAPLRGQPRLPLPGAPLQSAFLSHVSVDPDDPDTLVALIRHACDAAQERGLDYVMLAFAGRHPFSSVIRRHFSCHEYTSMIYVVFWADGADAAMHIDDRIPHPEVAIL